MERLLQTGCDPEQFSPLTLAFIGDAVFELMVRENLVCAGNRPVAGLHRDTVGQVCCTAQADDFKKLLPVLTEKEAEILKRGRNAHAGHLPKNAVPLNYKMATGFEALFGYLYLSGGIARLRELFSLIMAP